MKAFSLKGVPLSFLENSLFKEFPLSRGARYFTRVSSLKEEAFLYNEDLNTRRSLA